MNITEFAKIAEVSKSAVSRYFNNGYLSQEKKTKIEDALKITGYKPSIQAQTIRTRVTKLVGVILPKLSSESCARVVEGINEVLEKENYQILLMCTNNNENKEVEYLNLLKNNRVDGIILLASIFTNNHKKILNQIKIPLIIIGQEYKGFNCICHDDYGASYNLTKIMLEKKSKLPAYIGVTNKDKSAGLERSKGFNDALKDFNIKLNKDYILISEFSMESGYNKIKNFYKTNNQIPDSIFCATDTIAIGVIKYLLENNINVPEETMITSVGDSKISNMTSIPITTAHLHYKTSGRESAELFLQLLKSKNSVPKVLKLNYEIVHRLSTNKTID